MYNNFRYPNCPPYGIALKIVGEGRLDKVWANKWKPVAKELRVRKSQLDEISSE